MTDKHHNLRQALAALLTLLALVVLVGLVPNSEKETAEKIPQGYALGPEPGEDYTEYARVANNSLREAGMSKVFGLVVFNQPLSPQQVDELVPAGWGRVNAIIATGTQPLETPEPVPGASRADVIQRTLDNATAGHTDLTAPRTLDAIVAYAPGETLRTLGENPASSKFIKSVELAPPDAVWGHVGIRVPNSLDR